MSDTHTVMPKKLAQALVESGMKHFDLGGMLGVDDNYNASTPVVVTQSNLPGQITQGQGQAQDIYAQQQTLGNQLLAQSQGQGPNPAQAALNQSTGANVSNQAALAAGQRGASGNVGLMARQVAQQGANTQQQAVGQGATLQAQQQLGAQQNLANLTGTEGSQNLQQQQINQGALSAQNNATNTATLGAEGINAGVAATNTQANTGIIGGLLGAGGSIGAALASPANAAEDLFYQGGEEGFHGRVPGKASVQGNSIKNDVQPAMLSPGEVVLPRSVTQSPDAVVKAAEFMKHLMKKSGTGYAQVAKAKGKK